MKTSENITGIMSLMFEEIGPNDSSMKAEKSALLHAVLLLDATLAIAIFFEVQEKEISLNEFLDLNLLDELLKNELKKKSALFQLLSSRLQRVLSTLPGYSFHNTGFHSQITLDRFGAITHEIKKYQNS